MNDKFLKNDPRPIREQVTIFSNYFNVWKLVNLKIILYYSQIYSKLAYNIITLGTIPIQMNF